MCIYIYIYICVCVYVCIYNVCARAAAQDSSRALSRMFGAERQNAC